MTTDEIVAWNYGTRAHDDGLSIDAVYPGGIGTPLRPFGAAELAGQQRLGNVGFSGWAIRGWLDRARAAVK